MFGSKVVWCLSVPHHFPVVPTAHTSWVSSPSPHTHPENRWSLGSHPGSAACLGIQTFGVLESPLAFPFVCSRLRLHRIDSGHSMSFLMSRPAAELLSALPSSNHKAYISPSLSAGNSSPQRENQFIWWSHESDEVSRNDGMSLLCFLTLAVNSEELMGHVISQRQALIHCSSAPLPSA